jgi:hypothetical protein
MTTRPLVALAAVVLAGCSGSQFTVPPDPIPSLAAPFQAQLSEYLDPEWLSPPSDAIAHCGWFPDLRENFPEPACGLKGAITGSVVIVDAETRQIDPDFLKALAYPDSVDALVDVKRDGGTPISLATTPAEVGTVVLLWTTKTEAATYLDGTKGYRIDYGVKIIDFGKQAVVGEVAIKGAAPPRTKSTEGNWPGFAPWDGLLVALSCAADPNCSSPPRPTQTPTP